MKPNAASVGLQRKLMGPFPAETGCVVFGVSPIHGIGGFARIDLSLGTRVIEYVGERIDCQESARRCESNNRSIFALDEECHLDGSVEWNPARFLNHSCAPNTEARCREGRIWIEAIRDIRAGEEITFNYGYDLEDYGEHPCHCGTERCVGYIVAEELFEYVRQSQRIATT
jgi:SET domain-containing protein